MPYVITTTEQCPGIATCPDLMSNHQSRRAVATLEEAREAVKQALHGHGFIADEHLRGMRRLRESGGTFGPLPDGTVIEASQATWLAIAIDAGIATAGLLAAYAARNPTGPSAQKILDAFNAREQQQT